MSKNCKELENEAKNIGDNPVLAKETYLKLANCYEEIRDQKKAFKAYEKVAKIVFDLAVQFEDPEEAEKLYDEAIQIYKKIKRSKEVLKCQQKTAESYVNSAKRLHNNRVRLIYAIKYLKKATEIYKELKESDKLPQIKELITTIQKQIGLPIEELDQILEEYPILNLSLGFEYLTLNETNYQD